MPSLQDIKDGKFKVTSKTRLAYNSKIYQGEDEINELVARVLPDEQPKSTKKRGANAKRSRKAKSEQPATEPSTAPELPSNDADDDSSES